MFKFVKSVSEKCNTCKKEKDSYDLIVNGILIMTICPDCMLDLEIQLIETLTKLETKSDCWQGGICDSQRMDCSVKG